jgi:hypothetical protein
MFLFYLSLASRKRKPPFIFFYSRSQARKKAPKQIIFRQKGSEDLQISKLQKMHFYHKSPTKICKFGIFFVPLRRQRRKQTETWIAEHISYRFLKTR